MPITDERDGAAVAGVALRADRFLLVRRAAGVVAPGQYCFPGGMVETGETPAAAVIREFREELGVEVAPLRCHWHSVTPWNVAVEWWQVRLETDQQLRLNRREVDEVHWATLKEMKACPTLLESNRQWLVALEESRFSLTDSA